jgi:hypothetical protein
MEDEAGEEGAEGTFTCVRTLFIERDEVSAAVACCKRF